MIYKKTVAVVFIDLPPGDRISDHYLVDCTGY